jgi:hypothetical protein
MEMLQDALLEIQELIDGVLEELEESDPEDDDDEDLDDED